MGVEPTCTCLEGRCVTATLRPQAGSRTRTDDLLITNQLLYQLSYASVMRWDSEVAKGN